MSESGKGASVGVLMEVLEELLHGGEISIPFVLLHDEFGVFANHPNSISVSYNDRFDIPTGRTQLFSE